MKILHTLLSLFSAAAPSVRLPEEARLDHTVNNFYAAMDGASAIARRIAAQQKNDPKRAELRALKEQSTSTFEALARDMQSTK